MRRGSATSSGKNPAPRAADRPISAAQAQKAIARTGFVK